MITTRWWLSVTMFYIFNSTVIDWTCYIFLLTAFPVKNGYVQTWYERHSGLPTDVTVKLQCSGQMCNTTGRTTHSLSITVYRRTTCEWNFIVSDLSLSGKNFIFLCFAGERHIGGVISSLLFPVYRQYWHPGQSWMTVGGKGVTGRHSVPFCMPWPPNQDSPMTIPVTWQCRVDVGYVIRTTTEKM